MIRLQSGMMMTIFNFFLTLPADSGYFEVVLSFSIQYTSGRNSEHGLALSIRKLLRKLSTYSISASTSERWCCKALDCNVQLLSARNAIGVVVLASPPRNLFLLFPTALFPFPALGILFFLLGVAVMLWYSMERGRPWGLLFRRD